MAICNAESVGSQSPGLTVLGLPRVTYHNNNLFGPFSPTENIGDGGTKIRGEGEGEGPRQNAAGTANATRLPVKRRVPRILSLRTLLSAFALLLSLAPFSTPADAAGPKIHIVIAAEADPLEKFAAEEMSGQLKKLFGAETTIATSAPTEAENVILLGNPVTHAAMKDLNPAPPTLAADGHVLVSLKTGDRTILVVAGGGPRAVLWGAYELGWQFGVRYFTFGDLYPTSPKPFTLAGFELGPHRLLPGGMFRLEMSSPVGQASWGADELRRCLVQLAKLKVEQIWIDSSRAKIVPFTASLRIPVDGDTAGRSAFGGKKYFENPDLAAAADAAARQAAAGKVFDVLREESARRKFEFFEAGGTSPAYLLPTVDDFQWLARARGGIGAAPTAEEYAEILTPVCGDEVSVRVQKGFSEVSAALGRTAAGESRFDLVDPQMFLRQFASDEPPPAWWGEVRTNYLNAMNEMYRANTRAREGGRQFTLWYARRFEFGMEYMNVVEALRKAGIAKRKGNKDEQIAELEKALDSITGACNAIAATARSQSDRGIIAVMNEYGYRPVTKLLEEADASN